MSWPINIFLLYYIRDTERNLYVYGINVRWTSYPVQTWKVVGCAQEHFFFFVYVGREAGVLKIALPYPSVRLTNKKVILVTQPHKLVQTYILFVLLGWSRFILSLYWETVRDVWGNYIIKTVYWRNWEQTKYLNQNFQPPADIWKCYARVDVLTALLMKTLVSLRGYDVV